MMNLDIKNQLDPLLKKLADERNLSAAEKVATSVLELLNLKTRSLELLNLPRIDAELSRFELAPEFARQAAAFGINFDKPEIFDVKLFWIKKATKTNLSWLIGVTPNYEDSEANDYKNIGIDFVVPSTCDSLIILLSNRYKVRSLELKGHITQTQNEILSGWKNIDSKNLEDSKEIKKVVHSRLWDSFNFEPINRKFYGELVEHFFLMVNHLDKKYDRKASVMFTTRLIGRILFIWFLKKKNLIDPNMKYFEIEDPNNQSKYYRCKLEFLFFETLNKEISERQHEDKSTPYLNGGLFDIASSDFFNDKNLSFPTAYFNQLFEILGKYNFTIDESNTDFQQVAIDPEMLGRVFESLLAEQIDEDTGESKKKATGAYYTPREIVNYMCEESILEYLRARVPDSPERDSKLEELIRLPEALFRDQDQNKRRDWKPYAVQIIKALDGDTGSDPITILDPAVGSGAFPMGMLHLIIKIYGRLDSKYEKNISTLKKSILSKSLYGVDIESTAIEICRLRAWLSIIVDIPEGAEVEPLPNLDFKFICANTLIQLDQDTQVSLFDDHQLQNQLQEIRYKYYLTTNKIKKTRLQTNYQKLTQQQGLFDSRRTQQLKSYRPFDISACSEFYDPELHHGINFFDIVIGNPPYLGEQGNKEKFREVANSPLGRKFYQGKIDFFYFFFHVSLDYLKPSGVLAFITTNYFITATAASLLREDIKSRASILSMLNLGMLKVFDSAKGQHNMISILRKGTCDEPAQTLITKREGYFGPEVLSSIVNRIDPLTEYYTLTQSEIFSDGHIKLSNSNLDVLLDEIRDNSVALESAVEINKGIETSANDVFIFDSLPEFFEQLPVQDQNLFKPYYKNSNIDWYSINRANPRYILYFSSEVKFNSFSKTLKDYFLSNKEKLMSRREMDSEDKWFQLHRSRNPELFEDKAIVTSYRPNGASFCFKDYPFYSGTDTYFITKPKKDLSLFFILGILNSRLANVWFSFRGKVKGKIFEMSADNIGRFPIRLPSKLNLELVKKIDNIAQILSTQRSAGASIKDCVENKKLLDQMVYEIYQLTPAQVEVIESSYPDK